MPSRGARCIFQRRRTLFHFCVRAIVVQKEKIYSVHLRTKKEAFYNFFVRSMLKFDNGLLQGAKVVIDGSGDRQFRQELEGYFRRGLPPGSIEKLSFQNSKGDRLVQLADVCSVLSPDHIGKTRRTLAGGEASWHRRSKTFGISAEKDVRRLPIQGEPEERTPSGDNSVDGTTSQSGKCAFVGSLSNGAIINPLETTARRPRSANADQGDLSGPKKPKIPSDQIGRRACARPFPGLPTALQRQRPGRKLFSERVNGANIRS